MGFGEGMSLSAMEWFVCVAHVCARVCKNMDLCVCVCVCLCARVYVRWV